MIRSREFILISLLTVASFRLVSCRRSSPTQPLDLPSNWKSHFGGPFTQSAISVQERSQGGFILAGYGTEAVDVYLLGIDPHGDSLWAKTYGSTGLDYGFSMASASGDGFILCGHTNSFGDGSYDIYLLRIDESGDTLWTRVYGTENRNQAYSVRQCSDGGFVIAGSTRPQEAIWSDCYVLKTDEHGNIQWITTCGRDYTDVARSVVESDDGGFVLAGYSESSMFGDEDIYLVKLDAGGKVVWQRTYGGEYDDWANEIQPTVDGDYVVVGTTTRYGLTWEDMCLIKIDRQGILRWKRTYGGPGTEKGFSVKETPGGGFILAGFTTSSGEGEKDVYIVKTDGDGHTTWTRTMGGYAADVGFSIQQTMDGGYVVGGYTDSFSDSRDMYIIKIEP